MYEINKSEYAPENFFAGDFPITKDCGKVKNGAEIHRHAPIVTGEDGMEEATAATIEKIVGIAAAEPCGEEVVYYLTGDFFADALYMPDGVTAEDIKPVLRKIGIFLREGV